MKIAFYMTTILEHGGGLEKYLVDVASELSNRKEIKADVITMNDWITKRISFLISIYFFKKTQKEIYNEPIASIIKRLNKAKYYKCSSFQELRERLNQYDLIYSKNELLEAFILKFIIGYRSIPPVIFGGHTPLYYPKPKTFRSRLRNILYNSVIYKFLCSGVKSFHAINSSDEERYRLLFPNKKTVKVYNPFDFSEFFNLSKKYKYNFKFESNKFNVAWVGRLTEQKGIVGLVKIIESINSSIYGEKFVWNIVGSGREKDKILKLAKSWKNVNYLGFVENCYVPSILSKSNCFISTSEWEGFPYNFLEAQSFGLPVVSFDISGCNDIIENEVNGILVKNENQFKKALIDLLLEKREFIDIKTFVRRKFNKVDIYNELVKLFKDVQKN